jgi:molybdate transport system substrate-binding protein
MLKRILLVMAAFLSVAGIASAQTPLTIHVAAAANLQTVLTSKMIPAFEAKTKVTVVPVFGATKMLEQQMINGAPFDVFISADTATVDDLVTKGLVDKSTEKPYAIGQLVLWCRNDAAVHPQGISDLSSPQITHVAVANPATAPYGVAAIQSIQSETSNEVPPNVIAEQSGAKTQQMITAKIVYAENIQQALQYAVTGNADVAFTALSLVIDRTDGTWVLIPDSLHTPIKQSLAVAVNASAAAKLFAAFLTSRQANDIWKTSGYRLP